MELQHRLATAVGQLAAYPSRFQRGHAKPDGNAVGVMVSDKCLISLITNHLLLKKVFDTLVYTKFIIIRNWKTFLFLWNNSKHKDMQACEFNTDVCNGLIHIPEQGQRWVRW